MAMRFRVDIIESERGWGQRIDEQRFFNSADAAYKFQEEFNKVNTAPTAPDWYLQAQDPVRVK
jgi:hypothetical protein